MSPPGARSLPLLRPRYYQGRTDPPRSMLSDLQEAHGAIPECAPLNLVAPRAAIVRRGASASDRRTCTTGGYSHHPVRHARAGLLGAGSQKAAGHVWN